MKNNKITRNMMIFIMDNFTVIIQFNMNIYGQLIDNDESLFIRLCFKCKKKLKFVECRDWKQKWLLLLGYRRL